MSWNSIYICISLTIEFISESSRQTTNTQTPTLGILGEK